MKSTSRHLQKGVSLIILLVERVPPPLRLNAGEVYMSAEAEKYHDIYYVYGFARYLLYWGLRTTGV